MNQFETINQYDKLYSKLKNNKFMACGFFSLISIYEFMKTFDTSKNIHEKNLHLANCISVKYSSQEQLPLDELVECYTNLKGEYLDEKLMGASVNMIKEDGIEFIFNDTSKTQAWLFLKNGNFFTIFFIPSKGYFVRDSHSKIQYSNLKLDNLRNILFDNYSFNKMIDLDGYTIEEFSSIEYINVSEPIQLNFDLDNIDISDFINVVKEPFTFKKNNKEKIKITEDDLIPYSEIIPKKKYKDPINELNTTDFDIALKLSLEDNYSKSHNLLKSHNKFKAKYNSKTELDSINFLNSKKKKKSSLLKEDSESDTDSDFEILSNSTNDQNLDDFYQDSDYTY